MNTLTELLANGIIEPELKARKKSDALQELVELLHRSGKIRDPKDALSGLLKREKLASTGIGLGIAIPHLLSPEIEETVLCFARKREGLRFDSIDNQPVTLIFLIVGPENQQYTHLKLLSRLSRLLHDESFRAELMEASSAEQILEIVRGEEEREA